VGRAAVDSSTVEKLPVRANGEPNGFRALAPRWLSRLLGRGPGTGAAGGGVLEITSNVAGATVTLDGNPVGVTSAHQPLAVSDVAAGKHEIVVQKPGYEPHSQQFTMGSGQALPLSLTLSPAESPAGATTPATGKPGDVPA